MAQPDVPIYAVYSHPDSFAAHSGLTPLAAALKARPVYYEPVWRRAMVRSRTLGYWLCIWGRRYYGSGWNDLLPWYDEGRIRRRLPARGPSVLQFLFAEFASPRNAAALHRRGVRVVGTFHCSARRQPAVLGRFRCWKAFDRVVVVSRTQVPFITAQGVAPDHVRVIPHGVETGYFVPVARAAGDGTLRLMLVGSTERDHAFAVEVMRRLVGASVRLDVYTTVENQPLYAEIANVRVMPRVSDAELLAAYQQADLLFIPMLDCTANNAILEAMACGTPVMVNRIGGVPEYVDPACNAVMVGKDADGWADRLRQWSADRREIESWRAPARRWAERFDWGRVAQAYRSLYAELI